MYIDNTKAEPDFDCQVIDPYPPLNAVFPERKGEMVYLHIFPD